MNPWPPGLLAGLLVVLLIVSRRPAFAPFFQWLPVPLWCYALPMATRAAGWLPAQHPAYAWATAWLLPLALGLLLIGVDLPSLRRAGSQALVAMLAGAAGIVVGGPIMLACFHRLLPAEAWKGIGSLAGSWTGGSLNLIAVRTILNTPDAVFAPLVVIDALVAYSWMACLVACKGFAPHIDRWLRASASETTAPAHSEERMSAGCSPTEPTQPDRRAAALCLVVAMALTGLAAWISPHLPRGPLVASSTGWTTLLVTTLALAASCHPMLRRLGAQGASIGYPCLYAVLACLGAQADLAALAATPVWIAVGFGWLACHVCALMIAGRLRRIPLAVLATASQANVGGVVSAPLVGAVYHQRLAPIGLLLAIAGNALGTYLGLLSATLARWLVGG